MNTAVSSGSVPGSPPGDERELWTQQEAAARKTVLAAGCREIQLSDEEKERFRELVQPLYEKYAGPYLELVKKIQQG